LLFVKDIKIGKIKALLTRKTYRFRITILIMRSRNRTLSQIIGYGLYLYFLGLSFRNTAKALSFLLLVKISHVSIWNWLQKYKPKKYLKNKKIQGYIIDKNTIKAGSELIWLWVLSNPKIEKFFQLKYQNNEICLLHPNVFFHI
jgi:hypothetical protein